MVHDISFNGLYAVGVAAAVFRFNLCFSPNTIGAVECKDL